MYFKGKEKMQDKPQNILQPQNIQQDLVPSKSFPLWLLILIIVIILIMGYLSTIYCYDVKTKHYSFNCY